jgi:hypothetical protein
MEITYALNLNFAFEKPMNYSKAHANGEPVCFTS